MKLIIDISNDRYDEIMSMDWVNGRRFFDEELRAIHDGIPQMAERWIPVSERLPEIHQDVILSLRSLEIAIGFRAKTEPYFYCRGSYIKPQNVFAWMPLPEPYKQEVEG